MSGKYILLVIGLIMTCTAAGQSASSVYSRNKASVFVVENRDGNKTGSAVVIESVATGSNVAQSVLATNCHVVSDARSVIVRNRGIEYAADIGHCDRARDIALLTVRARLPAVTTRSAVSLAVGESVFTIGAPKGFELTVGDGVVSQIRRSSSEPLGLIQTTAPVSPGSSGGGLFDAKGNLVGITTLVIRDAQSLNFAVPSDWILEAVANLRVLSSTHAQGQIERTTRSGIQELPEAQTYELKGFRLGQHCREQHFAAEGLSAEGFKAVNEVEESGIRKRSPAFCSPDYMDDAAASKSWARFQMVGSKLFSKGIFRVESTAGITMAVTYQDYWFPTEGMSPPTLDEMQSEIRQRYGQPNYARTLFKTEELGGFFSTKKQLLQFNTVIWIYSVAPLPEHVVEALNRATTVDRHIEFIYKLEGDSVLVVMEERRHVEGETLHGTSLELRMRRRTQTPEPTLHPKIRL